MVRQHHLKPLLGRVGLACVFGLVAHSSLFASPPDADCQYKMQNLYNGRENDLLVKLSPSAYNDRKLNAIVSGAHKILDGEVYKRGCQDEDLREFARFAYILAHPEMELTYDFDVLAKRRPQPVQISNEELALNLVDASRHGHICPIASKHFVFMKSSKVRKMLRAGTLQEKLAESMKEAAAEQVQAEQVEPVQIVAGHQGFLASAEEARIKDAEDQQDDSDPYGVAGFFTLSKKI